MNKQEQIEEMAVIGCVRNPQAHTAEECSKCGFKQGCCNAYRHAEALYNAGYRKIPEGALVMTKEELLKTMESRYVYDTTRGNKVNIIEMAREIERKETAKEILQEWADDNSSMGLDNTFVKNIAKKYGVEVEE